MMKKGKVMNDTNINQFEIEIASPKTRYKSIIESLIFVSGEPLSLKEISGIIECSEEYTKNLLKLMTEEYNKENRGIRLVNLNGSYQFVTKPENSDFVQKLLKTNIRQSLSQAALETLAIVAYKQPVTRAEIDDIRGVKSDSAVVSIIEKNLICDVGRKEAVGRPIMYGTTSEFLKHFGLESLSELPLIDSFDIGLNNDEIISKIDIKDIENKIKKKDEDD